MRKNIFKQHNIMMALVMLIIFTFFIAFPKIGLADADNIFVEDYAGVLSKENKESIKQINEKSFKELPGSPQYAVVILKSLGNVDSIEEYAVEKFQKLGIGNKDLDNGFLFVISVEDRKYRLETGYGVEDVITDGMKRSVVTDEATDLLKDEDYASAVMLISQNIERLVVEKYSDIDASKEFIAKEKEKEAKMVKIMMSIFLGLIALVVLFFLTYKMKINKLSRLLGRQYIDYNLTGYVYSEKAMSLFNLGGIKLMEQVTFSKYLAKTLNSHPNKQRMLSDENQMKLWVGQYLLVDSVIQYWRQSKYPYEVSIYLEDKHLNKLKKELLGESRYFDYPVVKNPYLSDEFIGQIGDYVERTRERHQENLKISKKNKKFIESVSEKYLDHNNVHLKKIDYELEVALMAYYFLNEKDLSDPNLIQGIRIDNDSLRNAYRFAEKQRKQISSDQKRKALNDLTNMTLGSYYMQAMIWSSYHSSSSSIGGGGGSSFGGGSSGGGGFSGGW